LRNTIINYEKEEINVLCCLQQNYKQPRISIAPFARFCLVEERFSVWAAYRMNEEQFEVLAERLSGIDSSLKELCHILRGSHSNTNVPIDITETEDMVDGFQMISSSTVPVLDSPNVSSTERTTPLTTRSSTVDAPRGAPSRKRKRATSNIIHQFSETTEHNHTETTNDDIVAPSSPSSTASRFPNQAAGRNKKQKNNRRMNASSSAVKIKTEPAAPDTYSHCCIRELSPGDFMFLKPLPTDNAHGCPIKRSFRLCQIIKQNFDTTEVQWWETNSRVKRTVSRKVSFYPAWTNIGLTKEKYAMKPDRIYCQKMWSDISKEGDEDVLLTFPKMRRNNFLPLGVVKALQARVNPRRPKHVLLQNNIN
jgi:hypothetical protein